MTGYPYRITKRIIDILGGLVGILLFGLLYLLLGPAIKIDSPGPIVVGLPRISRGKTITLYKFRSMIAGAHKEKPSLAPLNERSDGPFFKIANDPRLTRVGKYIRKFRIDEVPQFINVLSGEMSLVGPRPHEPAEVQNYPTEFAHLASAKSGITGLSQVSGASSLPFRQELELDAQYLRNQSLWLDMKIIARTAAIMLFDPSAV